MSQRARAPIIPLLIVATILTLWPVCGGQFTQWDDVGVIAHEPTLLPPTWHSMAVWWTRPILYLYIPASYTAWGLIALIAKRPGEAGVALSPYPFHIANLILHALTVIVVYRVLALLVKKPWPAAAGAAVFALHPVQVEPVAWAMGLRDVLCGLFAVTAIWQYLLAISEIGGRAKCRYIAATVAYALAVLSKPSAITTPFIAAVLEWAAEPRMYMRGFEAHKRWRRMALRLGVWIVMAIPIALIARHAQPSHRISETVPILHRPIVALDAIAFYVGKIIWPMNLCIDYGRSPAKIYHSHQAYWTWLIPTAIAIALLVWARRRPMILAGAAVFVLGLLPVLGFVGFDFQSYSTVADRFLYVPMLGVSLMAASILATPAAARHARIVATAVSVLLGMLAFDSFRQTWVWRDTDSLFAHSVAIDPLGPAVNDCLAHLALGAGDGPGAQMHAAASILGNPDRSQGYVLLAAAFRLQGLNKQALDAAMAAYQMEPNDPDVLTGLATVLGDAGRDTEAAELFRKSIRMDPTSPWSHYDFGVHLFNIGKKTEALAELRTAAELAPTSAIVQAQIGDVLADMGRTDEARSAYVQALRLQPGFGPAIHGLLELRSTIGQR
jgi:cytochrome c-type biogenesis protein CcmH/NrfG